MPTATPPPSPHLTREDALPEGTSVQVVIEHEEVKDVATMPAGVAVPARRRSRAGRIDAKRGVRVPPVIVVPAKGTMTHAPPIKFDIAADHRERVLHGTPLVYGHFKRGSVSSTRGTGVANDVCAWCSRRSGSSSSHQRRSQDLRPLANGKPFKHLIDRRRNFHQAVRRPLDKRVAMPRQEMYPKRQADE